MNRRTFLLAGPAVMGFNPEAQGSAAPRPIAEPHFPSRLHQFVWRNWELANTARMAKVTGTAATNILRLGASMGLPEKRSLTSHQLRRIYITTIRQNWHILPESQIVELLGWTREKYDFTLKEDDFLGLKLGGKPECPALVYRPPSADEQARAAAMRGTLREVLGAALYDRGEDRFEHCANLSKSGISGLMLSWTFGGYASPNLAAAKAYYFEPRPPDEEILRSVAEQRYGKAAAPGVVAAWKKFSEAFVEFPYGVHVYVIPTQHGPANPLRLHPTGYRAAMMLFPYDDLKAWCGVYPPEAVLEQFTKLAAIWKDGLASLRSALSNSSGQTDLAIAETCYAHFQSVANQVEFCILRSKPASREVIDRMRAIAQQEIEIAKRQYTIARRHSLIAFEASNHYYYTPLDLAEKILNCRQVLEALG